MTRVVWIPETRSGGGGTLQHRLSDLSVIVLWIDSRVFLCVPSSPGGQQNDEVLNKVTFLFPENSCTILDSSLLIHFSSWEFPDLHCWRAHIVTLVMHFSSWRFPDFHCWRARIVTLAMQFSSWVFPDFHCWSTHCCLCGFVSAVLNFWRDILFIRTVVALIVWTVWFRNVVCVVWLRIMRHRMSKNEHFSLASYQHCHRIKYPST